MRIHMNNAVSAFDNISFVCFIFKSLTFIALSNGMRKVIKTV